jgi:DNA adenine methylase
MQYMGGKARIARKLADVITSRHKEIPLYVEPFVGAGWMFAEMCKRLPGLCRGGDIQPDLIALWSALKDGWVPPDSLSREEYVALRNAEPSALRAFAGFGCSFGGKWFAGYAKNARGDDFCGAAKRGLMKRASAIGGAPIRHREYHLWPAEPGWVVYCDPPYGGTTAYQGVSSAFDTGEFWATCYRWASGGAHVYVSEYSAPSYAHEVWASPIKGSLSATENDRAVTERLFYLGPLTP